MRNLRSLQTGNKINPWARPGRNHWVYQAQFRQVQNRPLQHL